MRDTIKNKDNQICQNIFDIDARVKYYKGGRCGNINREII